MRHELHFVENMHFVQEVVKVFENIICVVHTPILKMWRLMHPTFKLTQRLYYLQNSNEFKCKGSRFIHHKFARKNNNKQMLFILFTCLKVGIINYLKFAFRL